MNFLRVPPKAEEMGLDIVEVPLQAYPESVPAYSSEIPATKVTATASA